MSAADIDRIPAHPHARPGKQLCVDRLPHCGIRRPGALRAHVTFRRKPRHQIEARRVPWRSASASAHSPPPSADPPRPGLQKEVNVRRRSSRAIRVTSPRSITLRTRRVRRQEHSACRHNPVPLDDHQAGLDGSACRDVQHARGLQHHQVAEPACPITGSPAANTAHPSQRVFIVQAA